MNEFQLQLKILAKCSSLMAAFDKSCVKAVNETKSQALEKFISLNFYKMLIM